jgi:ethanolamine ammonia-lyase large subunit
MIKMQILIFNTTTKVVRLIQDQVTVELYDRISTVKCSELGFYEVMQKVDEDSYSSIPVFRAPIANTNMRIEK